MWLKFLYLLAFVPHRMLKNESDANIKSQLPSSSLPSLVQRPSSHCNQTSRGEWLYGFLDWSKGPVAAGWYIGLLAIFALLFVIQKYIHQGRDSALEGRRAVVAAQDGTGAFEKRQQEHNQQQQSNAVVTDEEASLGGSGHVQDVKTVGGDKGEMEDIPLRDDKEEVPEVTVAVSKQELDA